MIVQFENEDMIIEKNKEFEFLLLSSEVAKGFGISEITLRRHKSDNKDELIENKHFIFREVQTNGGRQKKVFWTKRGIIRLGFFIKSERAKKFRDWAEDLIINSQEISFSAPKDSISELYKFSEDVLKFVELFKGKDKLTLLQFSKFFENMGEKSPLQLLGIDFSNSYFSVTELGNIVGKNGSEINIGIQKLGYQTLEDQIWKVSESGKEFCFETKNQFSQLKWKLETLEKL